eukprot:TRINITY_DN17466_c0_g1_i1.p1 TRINITY_DN17466_c0_g1~~TRINITY_DN17466_c0_g1_i1.p1  ORF type:complete len:181 (+),score=55.04 TRINITY_DN17466_c0_g1_i1:74-616(+)
MAEPALEFYGVQEWCDGAPPGVRIGEIADLEAASYPADEKASREALELRLREAGKYFLVVAAPGEGGEGSKLAGFVCGTLSRGEALEEETMSSHDAQGDHLCIHSVVTAPALRRQGVARRALAEYMRRVREDCPEVRRVSLLAKEHLTGFYQSAGFELLGKSKVVHGQEPWFDLTTAIAR